MFRDRDEISFSPEPRQRGYFEPSRLAHGCRTCAPPASAASTAGSTRINTCYSTLTRLIDLAYSPHLAAGHDHQGGTVALLAPLNPPLNPPTHRPLTDSHRLVELARAVQTLGLHDVNLLVLGIVRSCELQLFQHRGQVVLR